MMDMVKKIRPTALAMGVIAVVAFAFGAENIALVLAGAAAGLCIR